MSKSEGINIFLARGICHASKADTVTRPYRVCVLYQLGAKAFCYFIAGKVDFLRPLLILFSKLCLWIFFDPQKLHNVDFFRPSVACLDLCSFFYVYWLTRVLLGAPFCWWQSLMSCPALNFRVVIGSFSPFLSWSMWSRVSEGTMQKIKARHQRELVHVDTEKSH